MSRVEGVTDVEETRSSECGIQGQSFFAATVHHALPVKVQVAAGGAGSPVVPEIHDPDGFGL